MKKFIALLLALAMVPSLVACGSSSQNTASQDQQPTPIVTDSPASTESTELQLEEEDSTLRTTQYGPVQGADNGTDLVWYHVPYAAAPVEELRWTAPIDPEPWNDPLDCTQPGTKAIQAGTDRSTMQTTVSGSEDCLYLDIYSTEQAENLPVLVFIHGGNNQTGSSTEIQGHQIVTNNDCVYVSLDYRLGLLGFNCLPALQTDEDSTGNYTLLDIAKALDWVKDNIAAFGGDPENITVSGFSAGGRDVMAMLISPIFKDKFDKAVVYSGGMTVIDEETSASQIAWAVAPLAVEAGKAADEQAAHDWLLTPGEDVKEFLYSLKAEDLALLMGNASIRMSGFPHLYTDGVVLPKEGFETTAYNSVPVLMLTGASEFSLFCNFDGYYSSPAITALDEEVQNQAKLFANQYGSDMYRIFNAQCSAETMYPNYNNNIYLCQIEYGSDNSKTPLPGLGSFHGIFVPMLTDIHGYGDFGDFTAAGYKAMAKQFNQYLNNFLATGDPNGSGLTPWATWTPEAPLSMVMDADDSQATAEMADVTTTYDEILARMDADDTLPQEVKANVISNVMNGRWFSAALDAHYQNPTLWK